MDFRDSAREAAFRQEVRDFLAAELPSLARRSDEDEAGGGLDRYGAYPEWQRKLAARGWVAPAWPQEYGGAGLSVMEQFVFNEEMARARAPRPGGVGVNYAGPTIIMHGSDEQKREHLRPILSGEVIWCQGFSEPGAGSDLAGLQTRAARDGDDYVINGQKIWTSGAQFARRMILLARTDPDAPKHKGISYFLLDMRSPGVTVRPLVNMAGVPGFNEVFFEDVRVPKKDLLGEENRGWYYATTTLDFERSSIGAAMAQVNAVEDLVQLVRQSGNGGLTRQLKTELADRAVETQTARLLSLRVGTLQSRGLVPNYEASCAKLYASELSQRVATTGLRLLGLYGQLGRNSARAPLKGRLMRGYVWSPAITVAGGTSEIQRGIIAIRGLGLPRG
ncbi:MAG TPA: acyl-CoA dehydrogenase family protein [Dehalococcoidia bacterium]|nr:acyl-CoA dehydrogenase family protein [Dehalococcoidia bacterium]